MVREITELVKFAEDKGMRSAWFAEDYYLRDAITMMASSAGETKNITLSTGVVNPYTRNPVLLAQTMATIDELSKGRVQLAIGTGVRHLMEQAGARFERPVSTIEESVKIIRRILAGDEVNFQGRSFKLKSVRLGTNPYFSQLGDFTPVRRNIPIYIAAKRPKMLQLAGREGDGVLLTAACSPSYVRKLAIPNISVGAAERPGKRGKIDVASYILTSFPGKEEERMLRTFIAAHLASSTPEQLRASDFDVADATKLREEIQKEGTPAAATSIRQETLENFCAYGTAAKVKERIQDYIDAGVTHPVILPVTKSASTVRAIISSLAKPRK